MKTKDTAMLIAGTCESINDIQYLADFRAVSNVVLLRLENGEQHLVVPQAEYGRAMKNARGSFVWTPEMLHVPAKDRNSICRWITAILAERNVRRISVASDFPHVFVKAVLKAGVDLEVMDRNMLPGRSSKNPYEIRLIRESQQAAVIAMRSAISLIQRSKIDLDGSLKLGGHPLTAEYIRKFIGRILVDHDCESSGVLVACGRQTENPHEHGSGPLTAHEPIIIDIFPRSNRHGYWGDVARTVVKGRASPELRRMYNTVRAAYDATISAVKPGIQAKTLHKAVLKEFRNRGYETVLKDGLLTGVISCTGHGLGLSLHECPIVCLSGGKLARGNVIAIEPGLCCPGVGSVRIEDVIEVTQDGCKYLAPCEHRFELL